MAILAFIYASCLTLTVANLVEDQRQYGDDRHYVNQPNLAMDFQYWSQKLRSHGWRLHVSIVY